MRVVTKQDSNTTQPTTNNNNNETQFGAFLKRHVQHVSSIIDML